MISLSGAYFTGPLPAALPFVHALTYFLYRMLDEMDGKQARRTGNSSPLGMLFDHGCDCIAVGLQNIMLQKTCCTGENAISLVSLISNYMCFHLATLEEYYLGTLKLPIFNGVSDGSLAIISMLIVTGCVGNTWWAEEVCDGTWLRIPSITVLNRGQIVNIGVMFGAVLGSTMR